MPLKLKRIFFQNLVEKLSPKVFYDKFLSQVFATFRVIFCIIFTLFLCNRFDETVIVFLYHTQKLLKLNQIL